MSEQQTRAADYIAAAAELAGVLFDHGDSCTRSVFQATTGSTNPELLATTDGFSCGIGKSGCLCGAVTGGVMALGLQGCSDRSGALLAAFKDAFQTTCCRGLSKDYAWRSVEHQANCRKITVAAARLVEALLQDER